MPVLRRRTVLHCLPVVAAGLGFLAVASLPVGAEEVTLKAALFVPPGRVPRSEAASIVPFAVVRKA